VGTLEAIEGDDKLTSGRSEKPPTMNHGAHPRPRCKRLPMAPSTSMFSAMPGATNPTLTALLPAKP
jgi:hypothetical protein